MRVNAVNYGVTNKQTNVASRAKRGMKQQPSFGMKMNNQHAAQKDTVSFGAPFIHKVEKELKEKSSMVSGLIGAPLGWLSAAIHEGIKESFDEPSTPREREARQIVNKFATKSFSTAATIGQIPFADSVFLANQQQEMVKEIALKAYHMNERELPKVLKNVGLGASLVGGNLAKEALEVVEEGAKEVAARGVAETASQVASQIPGIGTIIKTSIATTGTKAIGEATIKYCKKHA